MSIFRTKSIDALRENSEKGEHKLAKTLTAFDLTMIGVAGIIGAGIFVLTGTAAATKAGPAVVISFVISAMACALAGLCYAEIAGLVPISGSAYTYAYASIGEIFAWFTGWALVLEYAVGSVAVSIGWSGYLTELLHGYGIEPPIAITRGVFDGGVVNLPAVLLVGGLTWLLITGVKESARAASFLVWVKLAIIAVFLFLGVPEIKPQNWTPFNPFGWSGVLGGAGLIFFGYIGFDAITTTSEEAKNPQRDMPIGILGSLAICTLIYIAVAATLTGMVPYTELNHPAPVALALGRVGIAWGMKLVAVGAVTGLASVVLVLMTGQPRVLFAMSRDGLISPWFAKVHPKFLTPHRATAVTGAFVAVFAGTVPIRLAGEMTSAGTLFAFVMVCIGVVALRKKRPDLPRAFRAPGSPYLPILGAVVCSALLIGLSPITVIAFGIWMAAGAVMYFVYGRKHANLAHADAQTGAPVPPDVGSF